MNKVVRNEEQESMLRSTQSPSSCLNRLGYRLGSKYKKHGVQEVVARCSQHRHHHSAVVWFSGMIIGHGIITKYSHGYQTKHPL